MQKTRSWQESFDRLEAERREKRPWTDSEARQVRDAEEAYARAAAEKAEVAQAPPLMLVGATGRAEPLVTVPKPKAKPRMAKAAPRKRPTSLRAATKPVRSQTKTAKGKSQATKPNKAKPRKAPTAPQLVPAPTPQVPAASAESLLITPLPRNVSPAPWRKAGLFGMIGAWLRIAAKQTNVGFAAGLRRKRMQAKAAKPIGELAELRAENEQLRQQLQALLAKQRQGTKTH
jgi:hypothetical protein